MPALESTSRGHEGDTIDADGLALAHQSFKNVELALGQFDLTSESGQRDAITSILAVSDCVLAVRILLHPSPKTADLASTRNATCIAINGLRPQLYNYFNHVLRLDTSGAVAVIPPHMKRYSFATPTSREEPSFPVAATKECPAGRSTGSSSKNNRRRGCSEPELGRRLARVGQQQPSKRDRTRRCHLETPCFTKNWARCAELRAKRGLALGSAWWMRDKERISPCGETTLRAKRRAPRAYRQLRSRPSHPPCEP